MSALGVSLLGFGALLVLILAHVPIAFAMFIVGTVGYALQIGLMPAATILAREPAAILASVDLSTVPLFILLGVYATKAGFSADLFRAIAAFVGHRRGGLAYATIGGCAAFGVVCGSSLATAATFAKVSLPEMLTRRYSPAFATGTIAAGGALKSLIPPSVPMILYCIVSKTFVLDLFIAAIIPAVLGFVFNLVAAAVTIRAFPHLAPVAEPSSWPSRWKALRDAWPLAIIICVIFGGFYSGVFTINEAAAVAVVSMMVFSLIMGRLSLRQLVEALSETASVVAMIYMLVAGAFVFSSFLNLAQVPEAIAQAVGSLNLSPLAVVSLLLLFYLVLGSVFDEATAMLITTPFVLPIISSLGYSPIWWGVVMALVIEISLIHPPMGLIVLLLHGMTPEISLTKMTLGVSPYIVADLILLVLLVLFPSISLVLLS